MGSTRFRIAPALSSVLAALGTLQLRAVGILNRVDPLVSASNLYLGICMTRSRDIVALTVRAVGWGLWGLLGRDASGCVPPRPPRAVHGHLSSLKPLGNAAMASSPLPASEVVLVSGTLSHSHQATLTPPTPRLRPLISSEAATATPKRLVPGMLRRCSWRWSLPKPGERPLLASFTSQFGGPLRSQGATWPRHTSEGVGLEAGLGEVRTCSNPQARSCGGRPVCGR